MGFWEVFPQVLSFLQWGSGHAWFGLACPAHCSGSLLLSLAFLACGFSCGALAVVFYLRAHIFGFPLEQAPSRASPPTSDPTGQHGLTTFVCGLTRCMDSEADLSSAITEVQLALERLRIASIRASPPRATASAPIPCLSVIALSTALICVCGSLPAHCHLKPGPDEPGDTVGRAGHRLIVNRRGVL